MEGVRTFCYDTPMVFVDVETNGSDHIRGRVIEVAAIRVEKGRITRVFNQLIDPGADVPAFITDLTGIRNEDLKGAMPFRQIADEFYDILKGAVFVAHNVRFDYAFLKQEFKRVSKPFLPKQVCTVKLSRTLYPEHRTHKLEALIERYGFSFNKRHRAYDDAHVLWQFIEHTYRSFEPEIVEQAIARQMKQPALPKGLEPGLVKDLPETPGVYIFEDKTGRPLYIGKSINIKKRVLQHFGHDHDDGREYKIAQAIRNVSTVTTGGELQALLLESRLVKEMQPLYNRKLRRTQKLMLAKQVYDTDGYSMIQLEEVAQIEAHDIDNTLAVFDRRSKAREALNNLQKMYELCPKFLGLEKTKSRCFLSQLGKCRGACAGKESIDVYNQRVALAFERQRIQSWPYQSPILLQERHVEGLGDSGIIVDQWCVVAEVRQDADCEPQVHERGKVFDLDTYKILQQFLTHKLNKLRIQPLNTAQLQKFGF
ncbi:MAG TPA: exonuclease domain-containing protein [Candidatus Limnocylindrales bacterium]|nr:exonuclease domain-containing protein [Candidatus Limnocylindrales bacterium]